MLLAIDIGNTNVVLGVFEKREMIANWRLTTDTKRSADEYGTLIDAMFRLEGLEPSDIDDIIISSVVPPLIFTLQHVSYKYFNIEPIIVESGIKTGLKVKCDDPRQVGSDRIVNSVAAHSKYAGPLIVIDFGTATTFCVVTAEGEFIGGEIAPGIKTSSTALFQQTAKLPNVLLEKPETIICRNTTESIQSGLIYGHMGLAEFMVRGMKDEMVETLGIDRDSIKVIATGGMASMVESGVDCIDVIDKRLTLDGLLLIYEKNEGLHHKNK